MRGSKIYFSNLFTDMATRSKISPRLPSPKYNWLSHSFIPASQFAVCHYSLHSLTMPVERVPKKARLQEHHAALPTIPAATTTAGIIPTEQESTQPARRLGAQSNVLRVHYQETDYKDPLVFFSEEIALHILELLSPGELAQCACVSRQWYRLVNDQMVRTSVPC